MSAERHREIHKGRLEIFFNNFIGGIAWGLGASVGVSILFTVLGYLASKADLVPFVGSFVSEVINFVLMNNKNI